HLNAPTRILLRLATDFFPNLMGPIADGTGECPILRGCVFCQRDRVCSNPRSQQDLALDGDGVLGRPIRVQIKRSARCEDLPLPAKMTEHAAGFDLAAAV